MLQVATETFLKHSDNYYVRIDEIYAFNWHHVPTTSPHHSTLVINGNGLNEVGRHVHEDACPYSRPPIQCDGVTLPIGRPVRSGGRKWESRMVRI